MPCSLFDTATVSCLQNLIKEFQEIINLKWANEFYYTASLCNGDTINIGGNLYAKGGNYIVTLNIASGCGSVMQLKVIIVPTSKNKLFVSIKSGSVYL